MSKNEPRRAFEQLLEAMEGLRRSTKVAEGVIRRALRASPQGMDTVTAVAAICPAETRQSMNDALKSLETARHHMRLVIISAALDEGTSIGELGRLFGFSRQLAARYAKEARSQLERQDLIA